jgi:hypothetical protein
MYGGSGLSISQYLSDYQNLHAPESDKGKDFNGKYANPEDKTVLLGGVLDNRLRRINPIYNVRYDYLARAKAFFRKK